VGQIPRIVGLVRASSSGSVLIRSVWLGRVLCVVSTAALVRLLGILSPVAGGRHGDVARRRGDEAFSVYDAQVNFVFAFHGRLHGRSLSRSCALRELRDVPLVTEVIASSCLGPPPVALEFIADRDFVVAASVRLQRVLPPVKGPRARGNAVFCILVGHVGGFRST